MLLGVSSALEHKTPHEWAEKHLSWELKCVNFPVNCTDGEDKIEAYKKAADNAGLLIAEVGVWRNTLASDPDERKRCIEYAMEQLRMADAIGASCCVNVVGTPYGSRWDGGYRDNFSDELWKMAVSMIRQIIDAVHPRHTRFCIESMPWMIPSGPDEYLRLIEDVDRAEFGTHLDVVNMITSPRRYFYNAEFLDECFSKLHGTIVSCHLKDVILKPEYTFQLEECACGKGTLDIKRYIRLADKENPSLPMIIEHLDTDAEYEACVGYIQNLIQNRLTPCKVM